MRQAVAATKRRGALNPRSDRPRYPCGSIKPPSPNEVVVAYRRRLLDNPNAKGFALRGAENAVDLMLARGWLPMALHADAAAFRRLYLAAFPPLPDLRTTQVEEAPTGGDWTLDRIHERIVRSDNPDGNPAAMDRLRAIWRCLDLVAGARRELVGVCLIPGAWPTWLLAMIDKRPLTPPEREGRAAFFAGLHIIGRVLALPNAAIAA
jgi:hypothetical protein